MCAGPYSGQETRGEASALMFRPSARGRNGPRLDILRAVTMQRRRDVGLAGPGRRCGARKYADLVAITGDPVADIGALGSRFWFCTKGGQGNPQNDLSVH